MSTLTERVVEADPLELIPTLPAEPVTRRDVLLRAAELIEEHGWGTGPNSMIGIDGLCLAGAVCRSACLDDNDYYSAAEFLGLDVDGDDDLCSLPWQWNDRQKSSEPVVRALRRLADGATWDEATRG